MRLQVRLEDFPQLKIAHWSPPWRRCLESYLEWIYSKSGSSFTLDGYISVLSNFFTTENRPEEIASADVLTFINHPIFTGPQRGRAAPAGSTRNARLSVISSFYKWAANYSETVNGRATPLFTGPSPCLGIKQAQRRVSYRALSDVDIAKIFSVIPHDVRGERDRCVFMWLLICTRRRNEVIPLVAGDIGETSFSNGNGGRRVAHVFSYKGKGRAGESDDSQELPEPVYRQLLKYLELSGRSLLTMEPDAPLFLGHPYNGGGLPTDPWRSVTSLSIYCALKRYARRSGVPVERATLHGFRHSGARARADSGEDLRSIARVMRHRSVAHTDRYLSVLRGADDPGSVALERRYGHLL